MKDYSKSVTALIIGGLGLLMTPNKVLWGIVGGIGLLSLIQTILQKAEKMETKSKTPRGNTPEEFFVKEMTQHSDLYLVGNDVVDVDALAEAYSLRYPQRDSGAMRKIAYQWFDQWSKNTAYIAVAADSIIAEK